MALFSPRQRGSHRKRRRPEFKPGRRRAAGATLSLILDTAARDDNLKPYLSCPAASISML